MSAPTKSDSATFSAPKLTIDRVYTRGGDAGQTSLVGGLRVAKNDLRIECYGTVDELNSFVGLATDTAQAHLPKMSTLAAILARLQHELFNLGSLLATPDGQLGSKQARITEAHISQLEHEIDEFNAPLPELKSFVLPGGSRLSAELHVCRTVCRRAERCCVALSNAAPSFDSISIRYLNRLSDAFFVWSRWANFTLEVSEQLWDPNVQ